FAIPQPTARRVPDVGARRPALCDGGRLAWPSRLPRVLLLPDRFNSQRHRSVNSHTSGEKDLKAQIHPTYYEDAVVTCVCGNTFTTGSTRKELKTEICSVCHPFFTGTQRIVDTGGQVECFRKRAAKTRSN